MRSCSSGSGSGNNRSSGRRFIVGLAHKTALPGNQSATLGVAHQCTAQRNAVLAASPALQGSLPTLRKVHSCLISKYAARCVTDLIESRALLPLLCCCACRLVSGVTHAFWNGELQAFLMHVSAPLLQELPLLLLVMLLPRLLPSTQLLNTAQTACRAVLHSKLYCSVRPSTVCAFTVLQDLAVRQQAVAMTQLIVP
jgi:hypothetical protein